MESEETNKETEKGFIKKEGAYHMSVDVKIPQITMELDDTDLYTLQSFMVEEEIEGEFTEKYLILYNFALDCKYSELIQPDLIRYLMPFYFKCVDQAVIYRNIKATDIYYEWNAAIVMNQRNFRKAIGEGNYQRITEYYRKLIVCIMERENTCIGDWISLFNTTVIFDENNIILLFQKFFRGSLRVKYAFLTYLSVFLFKEGDNLLAVKESEAFWTNDVWDFDLWELEEFSWSDHVIQYFDEAVSRERIEFLFEEIQPLLRMMLKAEVLELIREEMNRSFITGFFHNRKAEFLQKMSGKSKEERIWNRY